VVPGATLDVSVVLPVYNERGHVLAEIERIQAALAASPYSYELIVVDDGSSDGSGDLLATVPGIRLHRLTKNQGSGGARRIGTRLARGDVVVWTDTDMTYPNERIPELVKELEGHDQVVGARITEEGTLKALRVPAKWMIRRLAQYLTRTQIPDLNSGLRAFRRDVALQYVHLLPQGFSCVTTMTMMFLANGYSVKYVPIEYSKRAGTSKFRFYRDTKQYLLQVLRMVLSYEPLRVFGPVGITLLVAAAAKLAYDWHTRDFRLAANTLLIFFAAFQIFVIGFLADLIVRVSKPKEAIPPAMQ
jgi:glycosyltransferase involved in cell wall biosynthesis